MCRLTYRRMGRAGSFKRLFGNGFDGQPINLSVNHRADQHVDQASRLAVALQQSIVVGTACLPQCATWGDRTRVPEKE